VSTLAAPRVEDLAAQLDAARGRTLALTDRLDDRDLVVQHSALMSPLVWDLAHVANYEELWLARAAGGLEPLRPELDDLYDAFAHPRRDRPALPLLEPVAARQYAAQVRVRTRDVLAAADLDAEAMPAPGSDLARAGYLYAMVSQHEQQHAETMLATHQLRSGPPVLDDGGALPPGRPYDGDVLVPGGVCTLGTSTDPWSWDNERPAHAVEVASFRIDVLPVTNAQYASFVAAGGYHDPTYWTKDGWAQVHGDGITAPLFWSDDGAGWYARRRFGRVEALPPDEPVQHVGFHEASAYARWRGRRLPTEVEWEKACGWDPSTRRARRFPWGDEEPTPERANLSDDRTGAALRPAPVGAYPAGASAYGVQQLLGDVWEWTSTRFGGYPGFRAWPYREYSQVFFGPEHRVLRGGSWATHPSVARTTFRNWDYPIRRQIFAGFRTAVSVPD
jgi:iron(II)-dependent oxidoreductase